MVGWLRITGAETGTPSQVKGSVGRDGYPFQQRFVALIVLDYSWSSIRSVVKY